MTERYSPATQVRQELYARAGEKAKVLLSQSVTAALEQKIVDGKEVAVLMQSKGWKIIEDLLMKQLGMRDMVEAVRDMDREKRDNAVIRFGVVTGILEEIFLYPVLAERADKLLKEQAQRRSENERDGNDRKWQFFPRKRGRNAG